MFPRADLDDSVALGIESVFERRDLTLHYKAIPEALGAHPLGIQTTWVARTFTVEGARAGIDTFATVLSALTKPGWSEDQRARWWASRVRATAKKLQARHDEPLPLDLVP